MERRVGNPQTCGPLRVQPHQAGFGAAITGLSLREPLDPPTTAELRTLWLRHRVVYFPDQHLSLHELQRFAGSLGRLGHDPYVRPMAGHPHVLEVRREADETVSPFGSSWHNDWSFQAHPPSATLLHAKVVPPVGGDTLFADGVRAYESLDPALRADLDGLSALHSARRAYSHEGYLRGGGPGRSMPIRPGTQAWDVETHPVVRTHPETGERALWINPVYTIGLQDVPRTESDQLLAGLFAHALSPEFVYRHRWQPHMLTLWDNRCTMHAAQGGYDGYRRVMHRVTITGDRPR